VVTRRLRAMGYEPRIGVGKTGVIADLEGRTSGPTLLIRADMDALPLDELPGRSHGSQVAGRMHACGHDAHTSALLGVAALLKPCREQLAGRVRLLFQPAEEIGLGALAVIDDGALEGVDEAIMAHVFSAMPFGTVALHEGVALMGVDMFELTVEHRVNRWWYRSQCRRQRGHPALVGPHGARACAHPYGSNLRWRVRGATCLLST
jgi:amidohydrolase